MKIFCIRHCLQVTFSSMICLCTDYLEIPDQLYGYSPYNRRQLKTGNEKNSPDLIQNTCYCNVFIWYYCVCLNKDLLSTLTPKPQKS